MRYFVDGYNFIFHQDKRADTLEEDREELKSMLMRSGQSITIVFDGDGVAHPEKNHLDSIEIVYTSKGQTADAYILDELSWVKDPCNYTIVTSDKQLANQCRHAGAHTQSIRAFLSTLKKELAPKKGAEKPIRDSDKQMQRLLKIFDR